MHVGTKFIPKSRPTSKRDLLKKTLFFVRKNNDFECFVGLELAIKTNEKSIKNELKMGRHRMDLGGFLEASWEGKWNQNRSKKATKIRWEM